ncbi:Gfo/Idh/MocA family oxidoreductase [Pelagicoccus enzymogenes]|uniref:Gfo/Idh/MocA family protein n=1 Tax=Pelagicoccus enzymogenes TaxID=2773457 RepID=UPI00280F3E08|nr:Gfo/Idh/MocA family oxidoreductase [Pelagicoccus enzymogenes]MDQ8199871.1 Gfo/Idh/MocA family oxidoreductase [Pelagicoccus enzymogenes]
MQVTRRKFVHTAATSALATSAFLSGLGAANPGKGKILKIAVVGCGGRGQHNIRTFTEAAALMGHKVEIVALADAFQDQVEAAANRFEVSPDKCIVGWDAYHKVAESGATFVILTTPPLFRPLHFAMMVEAGKHVMMEKPVAVDAPGCREIIAIGETAAQKGLSILAGTQRRHQLSYLKNKALVDAGAVGEIVGGTVMWNSQVPWIKERKATWSDADYLGRNWLNWTELSGDHICEQHVHNIDVANWFLGRLPQSAIGFGGRARRETGNSYDFFSVDLDYGNGVHIHSQCRQISGTYSRVGEFFRGTKGELLGGGKIKGNDVSIPDIQVLDKDGRIQEMVNWIDSAITGNPLNESRQVAESTAVAIMGRIAAYTGEFIRFRDLMENAESPLYSQTLSVSARDFETGSVTLPAENVAPVPGDGAEIRRIG